MLFVAGVLVLGCAAPPDRTEILVAAASDLNFAAKEIIPLFERQTGHSVKLSLGSSGAFHAQIQNGAPFDVFLSADVLYPQELEKAGLTEPGSLFVYAVGRIVLWVPKDSPIDVASRGIHALTDSRIAKVAIANPEHAPYGRAAVSALRYFGIYDAVGGKLVFGENVSQAAQLVQSRAADAAVIALSLALSDSMKAAGVYWEVPLQAYPKMEQGAVILRRARQAGRLEAARAFMETLKSAEGRAALERYGFFLP